jgi:hypothetical protein
MINTHSLIRNSSALLETYRFGDLEIPVVIETGAEDNRCYVTSFVTQYISYVQEEVLKSAKYSRAQKSLAKNLTPMLLGVARLAKTGEICWVNNALVSTPLYGSDWEGISIEELTHKLAENHPKKAIAYRGVDPMSNRELFERLKKAGFIPVMGRQVYIFDPKSSKYRKKRPFQMDRKLAEKQERYHWTLLDTQNEKEIERILELYLELYLEKHSVFNPVYTREFVKDGLGAFKLRFEVLKDRETDVIVAVQGIHETESVINTSFIGYDQTLPREFGLYRLMNYEIMQQAIEKGKVLNMSSGSGDFKLKRGGVPSFEYQMIYPGNLSIYRQRLWRYIANMLEKTAKDQMQQLKI